MLVVTSDHGEMLGDYGLWGKGTFHDAAFHVPLIIRDPGQPLTQGKTVKTMTQSIDVTPSLLTRMDVEVPHSMDGQSLLPFLTDIDMASPAQSFSEYDFGHPIDPTVWQTQLGIATDDANFAVLRTDRHRLVHFASDLPPIVFDMGADGEHTNLAVAPENTWLCLDLSRQMLSHRMRNPEGSFAHTIISGGVHVGKN